MGISGGEEGALHGPSIMFGGDKNIWEICQKYLIPISAKAPDNSPCIEIFFFLKVIFIRNGQSIEKNMNLKLK